MRTLQTLYIGLNDKDTHKQQVTTGQAIELINKIFKDFDIDSFTLQTVVGFYKGEQEITLKIEIVTRRDLKLIIKKLKQKLNQECIMLTSQELEIEFI